MAELPTVVATRLKDATLYACWDISSLTGTVSVGHERWGHINTEGAGHMLLDEYEWPHFYALVQAMNEGMTARQESGE